MQAMLDTGTTANFLASYKVSRLGLEVTAVGNNVKVVNAASVGVQEVTICSLRVGAWEKQAKLIIMPLNDSDLILGMELFVVVIVQAMPYRKYIIIMGLETPYVVPCQFWVHGRSESSL